jgi:hypothetical protein
MLILVSGDPCLLHSASTVRDLNTTLQNGLFSSVVASFIIETYQTLLPDNGPPTQSPSSSSQNPKPPQSPSSLAVRMNILMFLSLFFSLMSVLASVLIQQWCREYMKHAYPRAAPHRRGRVRTYLYQGLDQFQLRRFMYGVHVLLHISVFLFFWALSDFFYFVDATVGSVTRSCLFGLVVVYTALSISPLIISNSPYHTALTPPLRSGGVILFYLYRFIWNSLRRGPIFPLTQREYFKGLRFDRTCFLLEAADDRATQLDQYAMKWLCVEDDFSDIDMDKFLEGLPGYIQSHLTDTNHLPKVLTEEYILKRIREHFMTCATSLELSEEACMTRVLACVNSLQAIFKVCTGHSLTKEELQGTYIHGVVDDLNGLCKVANSKVSLRASCVRGLAFQGLLIRLTESEGVLPPIHRLPTYLVPLYTFFSSEGSTPDIQKEDSQNPPLGATSEKSPMADDTEMLRTVLHDGPLINLTLLAEAVLLHEVYSSNLSLCWKTLDYLMKGLGFVLKKVSDSAQVRFHKVHLETRMRVQTEGSGLTPLLEILDTVARGQRLSMVFFCRHKYHCRTDLVFGKEHLRNASLLQEFASSLPDFISATSQDESMKFMEELISEDGLWATLQGHLWTASREDSPIPDKSRVFVACCTVVDQAFVALEDSQNVDWRAPEFGSVVQHFELFVSHGFRSMFTERSTSFRIGILKARFCRALLAQFFKELSRDGMVTFRSQWDVASLARLFYTLGVGNEEDVKFYKSFLNGGHVGTSFMTKAHDMLRIAVRDGPLLNLCKLGRLAMAIVPFEGSDLNVLDVDMSLKLLQKMMDDSRLPLKRASADVWEDLDRLRDEVCHIISKSCDEDKVKLRPLFEKIDRVYDLRPSASHRYSGPRDHLPVPKSKIPGIVLSSRHSHDSKAPDSSPTIVQGRCEASPTKDGSFIGAILRPLPFLKLATDMSLESAIDAHIDLRNTLAHPRYTSNEHATHDDTSDPYPSPSATYILPPLLGNVSLASQSISPFHPSFPYIRQDIQHPVVSDEIHPRDNTGDSATQLPNTAPLTLRSPKPGSLDPASAETASLSGHPIL